MKTKLMILLAAFGLAGASAQAAGFIGNATPANGDTGIFEYWNFNSLSIATASAPGSGGVPTDISSDFGSGTLGLSSWTGTVDDFGGDTGNAQLSDAAEESLSLVGDGGNGSYIQLNFSMTDLKDLVIDFDVRGTGTGFNSGQWSYSSDGINFTNFGSDTSSNTSSWATVSPSLAISNLDEQSSAFLRYTLSGATSASGNNRIDNLTLSATAIPEPSSIILMGLVGLAAAVAVRKHKKS
jgi:hypothetical protein